MFFVQWIWHLYGLYGFDLSYIRRISSEGCFLFGFGIRNQSYWMSRFLRVYLSPQRYFFSRVLFPKGTLSQRYFFPKLFPECTFSRKVLSRKMVSRRILSRKILSRTNLSWEEISWKTPFGRNFLERNFLGESFQNNFTRILFPEVVLNKENFFEGNVDLRRADLPCGFF